MDYIINFHNNLTLTYHHLQLSTARPIVDTKGIRTPAHVQLKLKKLQVSGRTHWLQWCNDGAVSRMQVKRFSKTSTPPTRH